MLTRIQRPPPNMYRFFSTSACLQRHISHIGRAPIVIPSSATLNYTPLSSGSGSGSSPSSFPSPSPSSSRRRAASSPSAPSSEIIVKGPLGTTSVPIKPFVQLTFPQPDTLLVTVEDPEVKEQRQMWGTTRTLIYNAIVGMTEGFSVPLYLVGVGYRAALEDEPPRVISGAGGGNSGGRGEGGKRLNMKLGFSHSVLVSIPKYIKAEVPLPTKIVLSCTDKHLLGLFAAKVRSFRPPEPYKGKGVFVGDETIRIKQVKKK